MHVHFQFAKINLFANAEGDIHAKRHDEAIRRVTMKIPKMNSKYIVKI